MQEYVLVTGGLGYIGSHSVVELTGAGYAPIIIDDLSNSDTKIIEQIEAITRTKVIWYEGSVQNSTLLKKIFSRHNITTVMHFAAHKSVSESVNNPLKYYDNNLRATLSLLGVMQDYGVCRIIFSSSATVYGKSDKLCINELHEAGIGITNPYGRSKFMTEQILEDVARANPSLRVAILRYFNPIGAHPSGLIGESPKGIPNNLLPHILRVATGEQAWLPIHGDDYPTQDGTGIRDYIHVVDLARGHIAALKHLEYIRGVEIYNLGTGHGASVLELVNSFQKATSVRVPYRILGRRPGDIAVCIAEPTKALRELGWRAEKSIDDACRDAWLWAKKQHVEPRPSPVR